jgi:hypothetical protein
MIIIQSGQNVLLHLQKCEQHLFFFAANMNEITNDKKNYTFD